MSETLTRAENPVLDQPPSPAKPPEIPGGDRYTALCWIAGGVTPTEASARAGSITGWVARRTDSGLQIQAEDERLVRYLEVMLDELAADRRDRAVRLAADMTALKAEGWTQETARAALSLPEPRKPAAA